MQDEKPAALFVRFDLQCLQAPCAMLTDSTVSVLINSSSVLSDVVSFQGDSQSHVYGK